jgi:methyl-accepting chemotaxis protein
MALLAQIQQQRVLAEKGRHAQPIWSRPGLRYAVQTEIGPQLGVDTSWSALNAAWQAVKTSASTDNLDKLTDTLNEHIGRVSDQSNLTLDPDIDTYYLMDVLTVKWPNWLIRATRSNALLERSASQPLSAKDHDIAVELRILLDDALSGMQDDFAKATAFNPQLKTVLNSRQEQLLNQAKPMACNWTRPSAVYQQLQAACKTGPYKALALQQLHLISLNPCCMYG